MSQHEEDYQLVAEVDSPRRMPPQKPGRSKQDYGTPVEFLRAVKRGLKIESFYRDLAASRENAVCTRYFTEHDNALVQNWYTPTGEWNWLNPPFARMAPWVAAAYEQRYAANTAMLVPAGVGSNWWRDWVHKKCMVWFLNGRLTFVGETQPYPKDCALLTYGPAVKYTGYGVWNWRNQG